MIVYGYKYFFIGQFAEVLLIFLRRFHLLEHFTKISGRKRYQSFKYPPNKVSDLVVLASLVFQEILGERREYFCHPVHPIL